MRAIDPLTSTEVDVPPFATAEEAILRNRRLDAGEVVRLKMLPEHGSTAYLWHERFGPVDISDRIEPSLHQAASEWAEQFGNWFDPFEGWRRTGISAEWHAAGNLLWGRLYEDLWSDYEVAPSFRKMM